MIFHNQLINFNFEFIGEGNAVYRDSCKIAQNFVGPIS